MASMPQELSSTAASSIRWFDGVSTSDAELKLPVGDAEAVEQILALAESLRIPREPRILQR